MGASFERTEVGLHAQDGLNARLLGRPVEGDQAVKHAVVGEGYRGHAQFLCLFHQVLDVGQAVEQGISRVDVQMDEHRVFTPPPGSVRGKYTRRFSLKPKPRKLFLEVQ